jgi:tRNA (uracil-5-)-methyltransferase
MKDDTASNNPIETGDAVSQGQRPEVLADEDVIRTEFPGYTEEKRYISDQNAMSREYVDDYIFDTTAGSFFQNNNSVLSPVISYIRERAFSRPSVEEGNGATGSSQKIKYLLDAYCGSGLFTITLSNLFRSSLGVDISDPGIRSARANCVANGVPNANFSIADAASLFEEVPYPPEQTLLVIDPPRKGCDKNFLDQLLHFGPTRIVYVSCNVHTQARDIGVLVTGGKGTRYEIESIRGFDFFPQTSHVEGVAVLNKVAA